RKWLAVWSNRRSMMRPQNTVRKNKPMADQEKRGGQVAHSLATAALVVVAGGGGYLTQDAARDMRQDMKEVRAMVTELAQGNALLNWRISQLEREHGNGT